MISVDRLRERVRCHPYTSDAVVAAALLGLALMIDYQGRDTQPGNTTAGALAMQVLVFSCLLLRSSYPRLTLALTTVRALLVSQSGSPVTIAAVAAVLTVALHTDRRTAITAAVIVGPLLVLAV